MTYPLHVQLYLLLFLIIDLLSCDMYTLLLFLFPVTLSLVPYYSHIFCLHCLYAAQTQHSSMFILHMPTCMFIYITIMFPAITSPLDNIIYYIDLMITGQVVMVPKDDMFIYFYCFLYAYDILIIWYTPSCIYSSIMLIVLQYILLPPSFYHSLGRFLTTLGLHAQIGDPSYHSFRECLGVTQEIPPLAYSKVSQ